MTKAEFLSKWIGHQGHDALHGPQEFGRDIDALLASELEGCAKIADDWAARTSSPAERETAIVLATWIRRRQSGTR